MFEAILAGIDHSQCAFDAVLWAAHKARLRGLRLELVHVAQDFVHAEEERSDEPGWVLLEDTADRLSELVPEVKPSKLLLHGEPSTLLVKEARMVGFAVLGRRGYQDFGELLLGSTAYHVAGHVHCPAVVVPEGQSRPRGSHEVVVGVDGSAHAAHALRFAFEEAALRGHRLRIVHVSHGVAMGTGPSARHMPDKIRLLSAAALAGSHLAHPEVDVVERVYKGDPAEILVEQAQNAELLVVGARGFGDFWGPAFGSVSRSVLHGARCPLAVVRR